MEEKFLKITNAVYKILEFFPESDPLKNRAKDKALAIMESLTFLAGIEGWASFQNQKTKKQISEDVDILLGYLWIAKSQNWISPVNYLIISNEYEKIKPKFELIEFTEIRTQDAVKPVLHTKEAKREIASVSLLLPERQKEILDFLNKNGKAQVMDLQKILPNITKRTIRRDLDELLRINKITRIGEFNQVFYKINGFD